MTFSPFIRNSTRTNPTWCPIFVVVQRITMEKALERLTDQCIHACLRILELLADNDAAVRQSIRGFIHGDVTWHFCELRYRIKEVYDAASSGAGARSCWEEVP